MAAKNKIMAEFTKKGGDANAAAPAQQQNKKQKTGEKEKKSYPSYNNIEYNDIDVDKFVYEDEWDTTTSKNGVFCALRYAHGDGEPGYFEIIMPQLTVAFKGWSAFDATKGEHEFGISVYNKDIEVNNPDAPIADRVYKIKDGVTGDDLLLAQEALKAYNMMDFLNKKTFKKAIDDKNISKKKPIEIEANYVDLVKSFHKEEGTYPRIEHMHFWVNHSFEEDQSVTPKITTTFFKLMPDDSLKAITWEDAKRMCTGGAKLVLTVKATRLWVGSKVTAKFSVKSCIVVEEGNNKENEAPIPVLPKGMVIIRNKVSTEEASLPPPPPPLMESDVTINGFVTDNGELQILQ